MDGLYHYKKEKYASFLKKWSENVVEGQLWEKYVDLHIDEIDRDLKDRNIWLNASIVLFKDLLDIIDKSKFDSFLVIPLKCSTDPINSTSIITFEWLKEELDLTPPSFYLFPKDDRIFQATINSGIFVSDISKEIGFDSLYREEKDEDVFFRTLYIKRSDKIQGEI